MGRRNGSFRQAQWVDCETSDHDWILEEAGQRPDCEGRMAGPRKLHLWMSNMSPLEKYTTRSAEHEKGRRAPVPPSHAPLQPRGSDLSEGGAVDVFELLRQSNECTDNASHEEGVREESAGVCDADVGRSIESGERLSGEAARLYGSERESTSSIRLRLMSFSYSGS